LRRYPSGLGKSALSQGQSENPPLTIDQAHEGAYRFVAQYYERERIAPFMPMQPSMTPAADPSRTK
jgi:hypothetical protein